MLMNCANIFDCFPSQTLYSELFFFFFILMNIVCLLYCHTPSPVPTISWRRLDGASFGRKVDINKASGILEIPYFQQEDSGIYECVAENSRGRNSVQGKLSFYGELNDGYTNGDLLLPLFHISYPWQHQSSIRWFTAWKFHFSSVRLDLSWRCASFVRV